MTEIIILLVAIGLALYIAMAVHLAAFNARYVFDDETSEHVLSEHLANELDPQARVREFEGR